MKKRKKGFLKVFQDSLQKFVFALGLIFFVIIGTTYNRAVVFAYSSIFPTIVATEYGDVEGVLDDNCQVSPHR